MAEVKWIAVAVDMFDDEKLTLIEAMPDADTIIVIWLKILTLAGKLNSGGVLMMSNGLPYTDEMLSTLFRRPLNTVRLALATFEQFGMIEYVDNVIAISKWEKWQKVDSLDKIREQNRLRVAKHRAKQKALVDDVTLRNVTVTQYNNNNNNINNNNVVVRSVLSLMSESETDKLFKTYKDADLLIDEIDEELNLKNKFSEIKNAYRYVVGYAENKKWSR